MFAKFEAHFGEGYKKMWCWEDWPLPQSRTASIHSHILELFPARHLFWVRVQFFFPFFFVVWADDESVDAKANIIADALSSAKSPLALAIGKMQSRIFFFSYET